MEPFTPRIAREGATRYPVRERSRDKGAKRSDCSDILTFRIS